ncbi:NPC intracellular cholesterol transporter 2 homolog a-like [Ctenocephalides felis]|uniref:NPC intracellular cholesterol transporter 2 homolog a-like n=1 Tax=Ctenocephalides felis TaxID=7515 RepID=UPI000E6E1199|nr:NPC intracellular cholesterol transporter 2 homolog a-like [Ctenocephalides felis]
MWSTTATVLAVCLVAGLASAAIEDCGSTLGSFSEVRVSGCEGKSTCVLRRGRNVTIEIDFKTSAEVRKVNTVVHGEIFDVPIPFPLSHPNACDGTGLSCPLEPEQTQKYTAILPVLKQYPKVTVKVRWELQNENGEDIVCVLIPSKIQ